MNVFDLYAKISLDSDGYEKKLRNLSEKTKKVGTAIKNGLATAGKMAAGGLGLIAGAAGSAMGALSALADSTEEFRIAQGKLNTAFDAAGFSADAAQESYKGFFGILGDTDTATEASQLLAKLALTEEDVTRWTKISAGVFGTFGDSLPIEGLIESSNETARVGKVTGSLADALNWASISEDEFNLRLESCTSLSERNQLIMNTLAGEYDAASEAFYANNEALISARENQILMDKSLSGLSETISGIKSRITGEFMPSLTSLIDSFSEVLKGSDGAEQAFSQSLSNIITQGVSRLPDFLNFGVQLLTSISDGIIASLPETMPVIVDTMVTLLAETLPSFVEAGAQIAVGVVDGILSNIPIVSDAWQIIKEKGAEAYEYISKKWEEVSPELSDGWEDVKETASDAYEYLSEKWEETKPKLIDGWETIKRNGAEAYEYLKQKWEENVAPHLENFAENIKKTYDEKIKPEIERVVELTKKKFDEIVPKFEEIWKSVKSIWSELVPYFQIIGEELEIISQNIGKGFELAWTVAHNAWENAVNFFQGLVSTIEGIFGAVEGFLTGDFESAWESIKGIFADWSEYFEGLWQSVVEIFGKTYETFIDIGKNIIDGIWHGISGAAGWLGQKVSGFFGDIFGGGSAGYSAPQAKQGSYGGATTSMTVNVSTGAITSGADAEAVGRAIGDRAAQQMRYKGGIS